MPTSARTSLGFFGQFADVGIRAPEQNGLLQQAHVAQTFLSAGSGDFPVARPSPTFNYTLCDKWRGNFLETFLIFMLGVRLRGKRLVA